MIEFKVHGERNHDELVVTAFFTFPTAVQAMDGLDILTAWLGTPPGDQHHLTAKQLGDNRKIAVWWHTSPISWLGALQAVVDLRGPVFRIPLVAPCARLTDVRVMPHLGKLEVTWQFDAEMPQVLRALSAEAKVMDPICRHPSCFHKQSEHDKLGGALGIGLCLSWRCPCRKFTANASA